MSFNQYRFPGLRQTGEFTANVVVILWKILKKRLKDSIPCSQLLCKFVAGKDVALLVESIAACNENSDSIFARYFGVPNDLFKF